MKLSTVSVSAIINILVLVNWFRGKLILVLKMFGHCFDFTVL